MFQRPKPLPENRGALRWLLVPLFVLIGLTGGVIGGEGGPTLIEQGWNTFPFRFILLFAGFGALVGLLPGLLGGILTVVIGNLLSGRGPAWLIHWTLAMVVFWASALFAALTLGYLYLGGLSAC